VSLDALARKSGTFLMVAMDQRESLRTMLRERGRPADDAAVEGFKVAVARTLAPHASGFLIDRGHLLAVEPHVQRGLVLAVDLLDQKPRGEVEDTTLDEQPRPTERVVALKLLVIWRDDERRAERVQLARRFVALAERHGLLSVLEPVVRVHDECREDAIVEAARELGAVGPSLYKCQVPLGGRGDASEITRWAREIDAALAIPWVVLSQGVDADDFPGAVAACCAGGASGMLAGRAVWTATLDAADPTDLLREHSVPRLQELAEIVDRYGRPWREKLGLGREAAQQP
jgi:sulfofructosephosphate aldolase